MRKLLLCSVTSTIKKLTVILALLLMTSPAGATDLLVNGDFEQGATGWTQWWGGNSSVPTPDPVEGDNCAGVWWSNDGIRQDVPIGFGFYEFGGDLFQDASVILTSRRGLIRVEIGDEYGFWWSQELDITPDDPVGVWQAAQEPNGFPGSMIIDNNIGATLARVTLMLINEGPFPDGPVRFDNIYFGPLGVSKEAKFPSPYKNQTVPLSINELRWTNPRPNYEFDTISCDVYLEIDDGDPNFITDPIATGITDGWVDLGSTVGSLLDDTSYTWRVDCTDPNGGTPVLTQGDVWIFHVGDQVPEVFAGEDQYLWLDAVPKIFTLEGSYTDDGKSTVTRAEFVEDTHDTGEGTTVTIISQTWSDETVTADVMVDNTGWFRFTLEVEDGIGVGQAGVSVGVYPDACTAAKADPTDIQARYPGGHGDIDGDCDTDFVDFALLAGSWLDCMSDKLDCGL